MNPAANRGCWKRLRGSVDRLRHQLLEPGAWSSRRCRQRERGGGWGPLLQAVVATVNVALVVTMWLDTTVCTLVFTGTGDA